MWRSLLLAGLAILPLMFASESDEDASIEEHALKAGFKKAPIELVENWDSVVTSNRANAADGGATAAVPPNLISPDQAEKLFPIDKAKSHKAYSIDPGKYWGEVIDPKRIVRRSSVLLMPASTEQNPLYYLGVDFVQPTSIPVEGILMHVDFIAIRRDERWLLLCGSPVFLMPEEPLIADPSTP